MSEFLAEAKVVIRPDTTKFRAELQAQLTAATKSLKPIAVPVIPVAAGAAAQQAAGAMKTFNDSTKQSTASLLGAASASSKLDAALLGLRTALGSTAVIGLGATALAAIVLGKALRALITDTAAFEQELNTFEATTGASADQMERVAAVAERLGSDVRLPAVSAADAAVAFTELAKAGLSVEDALAGAEGVLQLATAAQISNAEASQIAANALNSFGLEGQDAVKVADDLANAANAAQGTISDFGLALRQSSAVAKQVGLNLEDTTAILSLFAKNGLQGSDAGTSLRVALIRLVAPTKKAADEIKRLGLNIRDANGNVRPDVFAQFGEATEDLTPAARDASAALIFGQDAIRAVSIGAREGAEGLKIMQFQIDQEGTAAEVASARTQGLAGSFSALQSNAQTLGITLGKVLSGPLAETARNFAEIFAVIDRGIGKLGELNDKIPSGDESFFGRLSDDINEFGKNVAIPGAAFVNALKQTGLIGDGAKEAEERLKRLNTQLQALQSARVGAAQAGNFRVADQLTLQIERLQAQVKAVKDEIAGVNGRPFDDLRGSLEKSIAELEKVRDFRLSEGIVTDTTFLNQRIDILNRTLSVFDLAGKKALGSQESLRAAIVGTGIASLDAAENIKKMVDAMAELTRQSTVLGDKLQKLQAEGAGPAAQIAVLQEDVRVQQDIIAQAEKGGRTAGDITTIRKARAKIIADNKEIESLQAEIESSQREAASKTKKAADEAARLAREQTEAFIKLFGAGRERRINQAKLAAGLTESARDDLAVDKAIKKFLSDKLKAIRERIRRLHLHGEALRVARDAIRAIQAQIDQINADIAADQAKVTEQAQSQIDEVQNLNIQIAEETGNDAALKRAINKRLKRLEFLIKAAKGDRVRVKELILERERLRNELEELNKKEDDNRKSAATFFFEQLQAQQGFVGNLLGNLITGSTAGLVGNPAPEAQAPVGQAVRGKTAAERGRQLGAVTAGQVNTTNELLHQILRAIRVGNAHQDAPEAVAQAKRGRAYMDGVGGGAAGQAVM